MAIARAPSGCSIGPTSASARCCGRSAAPTPTCAGSGSASRAGRARDRAAAQPTDHARLGRLPDPGAVHRPLRRPGACRQRRQHHGPRRALDRMAQRRAPAVRQGRDRDRLRDRGRRPDPARRRRRRRGPRPYPGRRRARRRGHLQLRQRRLPRGAGRWGGDGGAAARSGIRRRGLSGGGRARPRRRSGGGAPGAGVGAADRGSRRGVCQLLQPLGDRRSAATSRTRRSSSWPGSARSSTNVRCPWRHAICGSCAVSSTIAPA